MVILEVFIDEVTESIYFKISYKREDKNNEY